MCRDPPPPPHPLFYHKVPLFRTVRSLLKGPWGVLVGFVVSRVWGFGKIQKHRNPTRLQSLVLPSQQDNGQALKAKAPNPEP